MKLMSTCVVLVAFAMPARAVAQTAYVTDTAGHETKGKLLSWIASEIVLDIDGTTKTFKPGEAVRLAVGGDSLKNGALIGAVVGAVFGGLTSSECIDCGG